MSRSQILACACRARGFWHPRCTRSRWRRSSWCCLSLCWPPAAPWHAITCASTGVRPQTLLEHLPFGMRGGAGPLAQLSGLQLNTSSVFAGGSAPGLAAASGLAGPHCCRPARSAHPPPQVSPLCAALFLYSYGRCDAGRMDLLASWSPRVSDGGRFQQRLCKDELGRFLAARADGAFRGSLHAASMRSRSHGLAAAIS